MKIRIYRQTEQDFDRIEIEGATFETIVSRAAVEGLQCSGYNSNPSQRLELQGAPKFKGVASYVGWRCDPLRVQRHLCGVERMSAAAAIRTAQADQLGDQIIAQASRQTALCWILTRRLMCPVTFPFPRRGICRRACFSSP
ncbi:hypothetical protein [Sphingopyxis terrae]|uniref:hypothetical protein n=1 Tax=Sphingopyxis terrae TaxID=33052 RepID=UPI00360C9E2B